ncbi:hypothetical protein BDZ45DRAFT_186433 [Acephala macrosclerotiorum]|nr:hypothetical protein BDZ45DRAFT_186433 [Acephala macrosclerotiorum]
MLVRLVYSVVTAIEGSLLDLAVLVDYFYCKQLVENYECHISIIYRYKTRVEVGILVVLRSRDSRKVIIWRMEQAMKSILDKRL